MKDKQEEQSENNGSKDNSDLHNSNSNNGDLNNSNSNNSSLNNSLRTSTNSINSKISDNLIPKDNKNIGINGKFSLLKYLSDFKKTINDLPEPEQFNLRSDYINDNHSVISQYLGILTPKKLSRTFTGRLLLSAPEISSYRTAACFVRHSINTIAIPPILKTITGVFVNLSPEKLNEKGIFRINSTETKIQAVKAVIFDITEKSKSEYKNSIKKEDSDFSSVNQPIIHKYKEKSSKEKGSKEIGNVNNYGNKYENNYGNNYEYNYENNFNNALDEFSTIDIAQAYKQILRSFNEPVFPESFIDTALLITNIENIDHQKICLRALFYALPAMNRRILESVIVLSHLIIKSHNGDLKEQLNLSGLSKVFVPAIFISVGSNRISDNIVDVAKFAELMFNYFTELIEV